MISRSGRLVEGMSMHIPFGDKGHQPFSQVIQIGEVDFSTASCAGQCSLHCSSLFHPGAMRLPETNRQSGDEAGARLAPGCLYAQRHAWYAASPTHVAV